MKLTRSQIIKIQKNRDPYLMMDYANKIIPGKYVEGYKKLRKNEWFFKVHWPGDPNMPGMLQVEAMVQMSSLIILTLPKMKNKIFYLTGASDIKFFKKIIPGDKLKIISKMISSNRGLFKFSSEGYVSDRIVCKASFTLVLPSKNIIGPKKNKKRN